MSGVTLEVQFHSFSCEHVLFPSPLIEGTILPPSSFLVSLVSVVHRCVGSFLSSPLCSRGPCVCFISLALQCSLKSGDAMPLVLFFLNISLAIWDLFWFNMNFRMFFLFLWKSHWNSDRNCIGSIDGFGQYRHFNNINIPNPRPWDVFLLIYIFFRFFHQYLTVCKIWIFHFFG